MECVYCQKKVSSIYVLKTHQRTAKSCLMIQEKKGLIVNKVCFPCTFCDKELTTKTRLDTHLSVCKQKPNESVANSLLSIEKKIDLHTKHIEEEMEQKIEQLETNMRMQLVQEMKFKDDKIKQLEQEVNNLKEQPRVQHTVHNHISILTYMTPERVSEIFRQFTLDTMLGAQKALANFTVDHFLNGKDKPTYLCTDRSRKKFVFLDENGTVIEDPNCEKLVNLISPGLSRVHEVYEDALFEQKVNSDKIQCTYDSILSLKEDGSHYQLQLSKRLPSNLRDKERMDEYNVDMDVFKRRDENETLKSEMNDLLPLPEIRMIGDYSLGKLDLFRKKYQQTNVISGPKQLMEQIETNPSLKEEYIKFITGHTA
jgi:hypothetical protein